MNEKTLLWRWTIAELGFLACLWLMMRAWDAIVPYLSERYQDSAYLLSFQLWGEGVVLACWLWVRYLQAKAYSRSMTAIPARVDENFEPFVCQRPTRDYVDWHTLDHDKDHPRPFVFQAPRLELVRWNSI